MQSITKTQISRDTVAALTANAFPDCAITDIQELTEGMFNTAFCITGSGILTDGVILKIGPREGTKVLTYEKDILKTEIAVCKMLENTAAPAPKVLYADTTRQHIPSDYFFMTRISGILWKDAPEEKLLRCRDQLMEQLGRIHREIHNITGGWFGYIKEEGRYQFDSWPKAFAGMMRDICDDGKKDGHQLPYAQILAAVERHESCLAEVTQPQLVDFDLWAGNVLLTEDADGYKISGIIDFERSFFGDPCAEFISAVMIFEDVREEAALRRGYGKPLVLDESARIRMDLYRLYLTVIMYVETYRYEEDYAQQTKAWLKDQLDALLQVL